MTTIRHAPDCTAADLQEALGRLGDRITLCRSCRRFVVLKDDAETTGTAPRKVPTRLVCREHHKPVNAKGKGCPKCDTHRHRGRDSSGTTE